MLGWLRKKMTYSYFYMNKRTHFKLNCMQKSKKIKYKVYIQQIQKKNLKKTT